MNTNKTTPTLPRMAALKAEAVAEANHQPVVDALCKIRLLEADKAVLETENERLNKELMHPDTGGNEDGFWWFTLHLLALIAVFALGCVVGGAV